MKRYYIIKLLAFIALIAFQANSIAAERDPFSPVGGVVKADAPATDGKTINIDRSKPLTSAALDSYKIAGVIISDAQKIASIKAINGTSYLVKVGDEIGSEGGKISNITNDGITVQTETQEVKLPVNNKIEVPVENEHK